MPPAIADGCTNNQLRAIATELGCSKPTAIDSEDGFNAFAASAALLRVEDGKIVSSVQF